MSFGAGAYPRIATNYGPITPSDTVSFPDEIASIFVGGAGDVATVKRNGVAVIWSGVQAGTFLPVTCIRVNATGTTATLMNWIL